MNVLFETKNYKEHTHSPKEKMHSSFLTVYYHRKPGTQTILPHHQPVAHHIIDMICAHIVFALLYSNTNVQQHEECH